MDKPSSFVPLLHQPFEPSKTQLLAIKTFHISELRTYVPLNLDRLSQHYSYVIMDIIVLYIIIITLMVTLTVRIDYSTLMLHVTTIDSTHGSLDNP